MIGISASGRPLLRLALRRLEKISPRMTRMVVAGPAVAEADPGPFTDTYVRLVVPGPGATFSGDHDLVGGPARAQRSSWRTRTYTVRSIDRARGELAIDIYGHGRAGLTASWLATVRPGDPVLMCDLRGRYRPVAEADWHLLAGDDVALPAMATTLAAMAPGTRATVLVEVGDAADEVSVPTAADCEIRWLHRARGESLAAAVRSLAFAPGVVQAFVHGEGGVMPELRRFLLDERGLARELLSISGYWRQGLNDEQWRRAKAVAARR